MLVALREFQLAGISHTIPFHLAVLEHPEFIAGNLTTHFYRNTCPGWRGPVADRNWMTAVAAVEGRSREDPPPVMAATSEAQLWKMAGR